MVKNYYHVKFTARPKLTYTGPYRPCSRVVQAESEHDAGNVARVVAWDDGLEVLHITAVRLTTDTPSLLHTPKADTNTLNNVTMAVYDMGNGKVAAGLVNQFAVAVVDKDGSPVRGRRPKLDTRYKTVKPNKAQLVALRAVGVMLAE